MRQQEQVTAGDDSLVRIINEKRLSCCVECGKCVATCPMGEFYGSLSFLFSPRGIITKALLGADILRDSNIWFCLECDMCARMCPAGVKYAEFVEDIRQLAMKEGVTENSVVCPRCGHYYLPLPTVERLREVLAGVGLGDEFAGLCPQCRRDDTAKKLAFPTPLVKSEGTRHHRG
ncbi:MAG: 4Fe-4S dicluster domain-containing protein [Dehalococcoidia bacterium]|jgi:heterodisulfide reductase subunit C